MNPDMNRRIRHEVFDECRARFVSEYGVIGPCHLDSIREYLAPEEMQPDSLAWQLHTNMHEKETMAAAIRLHYTDPEDLSVAEYSLYGQLFQAIIHEHAMEALALPQTRPAGRLPGRADLVVLRLLGRDGLVHPGLLPAAQGELLLVPAGLPAGEGDRAPARRPAGHPPGQRLPCEPCTATVEFGWRRLDGVQEEIDSRRVTFPLNSMQPVSEVEIPSADEKDPHEWLYAAVLRQEEGQVGDQSIWTLLPHRQLSLSSPRIEVVPLPDRWLEVSCPTYCHAVHVEDHGHEVISDNWFDLLPGIPVRVRLAQGITPDDIQFHAVFAGKS